MEPWKFFEIRENLNITQKDLAKYLGVSLHSVQSYEQSRRKIPKYISRLMYFINKRQRAYKRTKQYKESK